MSIASQLSFGNAAVLTTGTLSGDRGVTAGSTTVSFVEYNGTTATAGQFDGGTVAPSATTRLNYNGNLHATNFVGSLTGAATTSGTVTTAAQPNITSVGTLSSLAVTANANVGNLNSAGRVIATDNMIVTSSGGEGGQIVVGYVGVTGITGQANSTWNMDVDASNNFRLFSQNATGVVSGVSMTAYSANTNVLFAGNVSAPFFIGNGSQLTGIVAAAGASIVNGTSNVVVDASGNVRTSVAGTANVLIVTATGANIAGTLNATGNANVGNIGATRGVFTNVSGEGGNLSNIQGGNVSGAVASATAATNASALLQNTSTATTVYPTFTTSSANGNSSAVINTGISANLGNASITATTFVGALSGAATSATTAGTVTTAAQPNITSVGTLTSLGVNGTVTAVAFTANTGVFTGNGNGLSSIVGANVTGTVASATAATNASALLQNTSTATTVYPTFSTSSANGNSSAVISTGISANLGNNAITATTFVGALSGAATSATTAGTVTTAAQPNITSVGTLTSLGVNGTVTAVAFTANTGVFTGNANGLSSIQGANVVGTVASATAATNASALLQNTSTATSVFPTFSTSSANGNSSAVISSGISANLANNAITATTFVGALSGAATSATTAGTVTTAAQPNITSVGTLTSLGVNGTVTAVAFTANTGVFTGNGNGLSSIVGANVTGTVASATAATNASALLQNTSTATSVFPTFSTTSANGNSSAVISTGISANLGNNAITATTFVGALSGNATTAGTVVTAAQPNITSVGTLTSATVTGNVAAGNLTTTGVLSVTGTGVSSIAGNLDMTGNTIINLATPTASTDAATKQYVDDVAQGLNIHDSCQAATNTTLATITGGTITYNNGTSGVGANLTTTGSFNLIDGVNVQTLGTRILVKNEANAVHNGIYTWSNATVITRATDYDTVPEVEAGDFVFITAGTLYDNTGWVQTSTVTAIGTAGNNIDFTQFSGAGTYQAGTGLTLTGSTFSVNASQTQITSVGTLTSLGVSGTVTAPAFTANTGVFTGNGNGLSSIVGANVTGTVASATAATNASALLQNTSTSTTAWPTFTTSSANGNSQAVFNTGISANLGNSSITATTFVGALSGNATTAGTVVTAAQPNITSVGTLTSLAVTGNVTAGNLIGPYANGNSNVNIPAANGNVNTSVGGTANVLVVTPTGANITGTLNVTGNASFGNIVSGGGSGGNISGANVISANTFTSIIATGTAPLTVTSTTRVSNLNVAQAGVADSINVAAGTGNNFIIFANAATGNITELTSTGLTANLSNNSITATTFVGAVSGDISAGTNANASNISSGTLAQARLANASVTLGSTALTLGSTVTTVAGLSSVTSTTFVGSLSGAATTAGTVTTAAQPNITSVGLLANLNAGAITINGTTGLPAQVSGQPILTGTLGSPNIGALYIGDGSGWNFKFRTRIGSADTDRVTFFDNGNVTLNTGVITGNGSGLSAIAGANVTGTVASATTAGTVTTAAQPNITSVGTLTSLAVSGTSGITSTDSSGAASTNKIIRAVNGTQDISLIPRAGSGSFNNLTIADDMLIVFANTSAQGNANLTIAPWASANSGIRIQSVSNVATIFLNGNTVARSNIAYVSPNGANTINSTMLNGGTLAWSGNAGQLFSIADSMTGNIFTVNDVSGIPMISVDAGGNIQFAVSGGFVNYGVTTGITAAGSTQGTATALTRPINVVSTVSASTGVILPTVPAGARVIVMNTSATALNVYPPTSAAINSAATNAAYSMPAGTRLEFISVSATQWYTMNATYG